MISDVEAKPRRRAVAMLPSAITVANLLAGVFAMLPAPAFAELPPLIPRDVLFGNPDKAGPQISPDGKHIAYLAPDKNNVLQVWVRSTKPPKGEADDKQMTSDEKRGIRQYFWAHDGKHLLYMQDAGGDENFHLFASELSTGKTRDLTPFPGVRAQGVATNYAAAQRWNSGHLPRLIIAQQKFRQSQSQFSKPLRGSVR